MRRQSELEKRSHDVSGTNDMEYFYDLAKKLIQTGGHGDLCCAALQFFAWQQKLQLLKEEKKVVNYIEGKVAELAKGEEAFKVEQAPLFYTLVSVHYQQNLRSKRFSHSS